MAAPKNGEPTHSANCGRKQTGHIRQSYADHYNQIGEFDRLPPFDKLTVKDMENKRQPSFNVDWIKQKILMLGELSNLNNSARAVIFIVIETGARWSEIFNLTPDCIYLDAPAPYIEITPTDAGSEHREIKPQ